MVKLELEKLVVMFKSKNPNAVRLAFEYKDMLSDELKSEIKYYLWRTFHIAPTFGEEIWIEINKWPNTYDKPTV